MTSISNLSISRESVTSQLSLFVTVDKKIIELIKEYLLLGEAQRIYVAVDWGSGAIKSTVAVVNTSNNTIDSIQGSSFDPLKLTEDLHNTGGMISESMVASAFAILQNIKGLTKKVASEYVAETDHSSIIQYAGIATAVFRDKAKNGVEVLERAQTTTLIPFRVLSQKEEGILGFMTARALYPEVDERHILAYDSGNGSYQLTAKQGSEFLYYPGPLAAGNVRTMLKTTVRGEAQAPAAHESCNPVTSQEVSLLTTQIQAKLPAIRDFGWLNTMLSSRYTVVASFGADDSIFALTAMGYETLVARTNKAWQGSTLTYTQVQQTLDVCTGKKDEDYVASRLHLKTTTSALLLKTVMQHHRIEKIQVKEAMGSTLGMLLSRELWK